MRIFFIISGFTVGIVLLTWLGFVYATNSADDKRKVVLDSTQLYLRNNRDVYGVSNKGTSMDNVRVYSVSANKIGI